MEEYKYLDITGLSYYNSKIKEWTQSKIDTVESTLTDQISEVNTKATAALTCWNNFLTGLQIEEGHPVPTLKDISDFMNENNGAFTEASFSNSNTGTQYISASSSTQNNGKKLVLTINDSTLSNTIDAIKNYTVNGKKINTNPILTGADISMSTSDEATINSVITTNKNDISNIKSWKINGTSITSNTVLGGTNLRWDGTGSASGQETIKDKFDEITSNISELTVNNKKFIDYNNEIVLNATDIKMGGSSSGSNSSVYDVIESIKNSVAGGVHFIGVKDSLPSEGVLNGDVVIVGNKEFIWNDSQETSVTPNYKWVELGDTTVESERITALENTVIKNINITGTSNNGLIDLSCSVSNNTATINVDTSNLDAKISNIEGNIENLQGSSHTHTSITNAEIDNLFGAN